ncbi:alkene reductase [Luedemannella helvata]|uniref:Alkene reductase n=1 Tax=Luedemannella helvata TaxID=349315 RepID=A0ABP4WDK3_9ACTN
MTTAFDQVAVGRYTARNRIVMAPMTRSRAYGPGATPTDLMVTYYAQRAGAGLIITEGTQPSAVGQGYPDTPGLHTPEQVAAWQKVTAAVHERGGLIFAQLMHAGRIGHPDQYGQEGLTPVGVSPVAAAGTIYTHNGPRELPTPVPLDEAGIRATIADFAAAARNAIEAGFDGVELHGANGYLPHQFLSTNANLRDDAWGGDVAGRIRFFVEVSTALADAVGADRVGVRVSPGNAYNDIVEADHRDTYLALVDALNPLGLAYLHVVAAADPEFAPILRGRWRSTFILNPSKPGGYTSPEALGLIERNAADLVSYAALFLANPDLPERLRVGGPFNEPDLSKAFGGDHTGYTDYPTLS